MNIKDFIQKIISMNSHEIKDLVNVFLKENKLEKGLLDVEVRKIWFEMMDNGVANYTTDVSLRNKTLYIKLNSAALKQELSYGKEKLKNLINQKFKKEIVQKIILG
tara:strand:+ start:1752 stop:2069 length:318 start_codon:yes stop_codon:yes gene_type:complete